jgi:hypothetical protein
MLRTFKLLLLAVVLNGCASGKLVGKIPSIENDRFAIVQIVRPSGLTGCVGRITIQLDHNDLYYLACGEHLIIKVSAEKPLIVSETTSVVPDHFEFNPEVGKQYYFEHVCTVGACSLQLTNKYKFKKLVDGCKHIDLSS